MRGSAATVGASRCETPSPHACCRQEEAKNADWLVLWLDCDREGENIAYEVIEVCKKANSRLDIYRARFSSVDPRAVNQAVRHRPRCRC